MSAGTESASSEVGSMHMVPSGSVALYPLSAAQSGIWVRQRLDPDSPAYNIAEYVEILGPVDPALFKIALREVVAKTGALHIRVVETDGILHQYVAYDPNWA